MRERGLEILFEVGGYMPSEMASKLSKISDEDLISVKEYVHTTIPKIDKSWVKIIDEEYVRRVKENRIDKLNELGI